MTHHPRRTAALVAATALAGLGATLPAAGAHAATPSRITVAASDTSVSSGEQLVLSGRLSQAGVVRVVAKDGTSWTPLTGAVVHTRRDGSYAVRVVLSRAGDRVLRVVGDPDAAGVRTSRARVVVHVS
ncbi:hypothetical protein ABFT23_11675 [Nocardioides sp. C4-1]|uniref:hypothetical protein n=1 Tax=Nocardioides sp. C4-1 TaxID=3151851 RepID=UPI003267DE90